MTVTHPAIAFSDTRGSITDVISHGAVHHVAVLETHAGSTRGNHYHARSTMHVFVLRGRFRVRARYPNESSIETEIGPGDLVAFGPQERHALTAVEDGLFLALVQGPDGGQQHVRDTVREDV